MLSDNMKIIHNGCVLVVASHENKEYYNTENNIKEYDYTKNDNKEYYNLENNNNNKENNNKKYDI
jgi:hypothetical protein